MHNREFEHTLPYFTTTLTWAEKPNDPIYANLNSNQKKKMPLSLDLAIYPNLSGRIIINYPGFDEGIDGINLRYKDIALKMQSVNLGSVIRCAHPIPTNFLPTTNLKKAIDYSLENAEIICGFKKPKINLMGFSAGASAIAAVAASYQEVSKILLIAPSGDTPKELVQEKFEKFTGEVYIIIGENDEVVGTRAGQIYYDLAISARHREFHIIPNCDHYFNGEINDNIFKKAPFYAFTQGKKPEFI